MTVKTADAVVIGGGVNGCSIAYHLAKSGIKKVILLEKHYTASGPTGRSSGIVRQHYTIEALAKIALYSLQVFQRFGEEIGVIKGGWLFAPDKLRPPEPASSDQ